MFESNTLETEQNESDDAGYIAGTLARAYGNIYFRAKGRAGSHTNVHTKGLIAHHPIALVRDGQSIELRLQGVLPRLRHAGQPVPPALRPWLSRPPQKNAAKKEKMSQEKKNLHKNLEVWNRIINFEQNKWRISFLMFKS